MNQPLDVLIFAPHPDDAELGMGGTILKLIDRGKRVGVIDLCQGEMGTKSSATTRAEEVRESSRILGLHHRGNLDFGDARIADTHENRLKVADAIRRFRSPQVFVCAPDDPHPDHEAGSKVIKGGFFLSRLQKIETEYPAFSPHRLLYYFLHEFGTMTFAINISDYFETKLNALRAFKSQFVEPELPKDYRYIGTSDYLKQIDAYNRTIGAKIGETYAEAFYSPAPIPLDVPTDIM